MSRHHVKRFSHESAELQTDTHIHAHTDRTDFIPSTAYAGGNDRSPIVTVNTNSSAAKWPLQKWSTSNYSTL